MENISFFILSIISILLGIILFTNGIAGIKFSILNFFIFLLILPTSNLFNPFLSESGIFFYDFYFFILFIHFIIRIIATRVISKKSLFFLITFVLFISFYALLFLYEGAIIDKYLLRDFRPFLTLIYSMLIINLLNNNFGALKIESFSINGIIRILIIAFISHIIIFFIVSFFSPLLTTDLYYKEHNYRYIDAKSFVAALFLIFSLSINTKGIYLNRYLFGISLVLAIIVLLISNSRTLLATTIILILIGANLKFYNKMIFMLFIGAGFYFYVNYFEISRILSLDLFASLETRYAPAIDKIRGMSTFEAFVGCGYRTFFEIPWFVRRDLDPYLNSIDSMYLTFFVKYGMFSIVLILLFLNLVTENIQNRKNRFLIILFFLLLFFTYSPLYQSYSIVYMFYIILFSFIVSDLKRSNNKMGLYKQII